MAWRDSLRDKAGCSMDTDHDGVAPSQPPTNCLSGGPIPERESDEPALGGVALGFERQRQFSLLNELPAIVYVRAPDYAIHFANLADYTFEHVPVQ